MNEASTSDSGLYTYLYLVHIELAHIKITSNRNEIWARDLYHFYSTC